MHRCSNFESNPLFYLPICIQESVGNLDDECPYSLITESPKIVCLPPVWLSDYLLKKMDRTEVGGRLGRGWDVICMFQFAGSIPHSACPHSVLRRMQIGHSWLGFVNNLEDRERGWHPHSAQPRDRVRGVRVSECFGGRTEPEKAWNILKGKSPCRPVILLFFLTGLDRRVGAHSDIFLPGGFGRSFVTIPCAPSCDPGNEGDLGKPRSQKPCMKWQTQVAKCFFALLCTDRWALDVVPSVLSWGAFSKRDVTWRGAKKHNKPGWDLIESCSIYCKNTQSLPGCHQRLPLWYSLPHCLMPGSHYTNSGRLSKCSVADNEFPVSGSNN